MNEGHEELLEELEAMYEHGAYLVRPLDTIRLTGADRVRFLNGQVTCELKGIEPTAVVHGYFTSAKGRVETAVMVQVDFEELRLILPPGQGEKVAARLRKYIITDRVELEVASNLGFYVLGENGLRRLDPLSLAVPKDAYQWVPYELQFQLQTLTRLPNLGLERDVPCVVLIAEVAERNAEAFPQTDLQLLDEALYQQLRIEAGWPEAGHDYGDGDCFPQELADEKAVSYTKGCYLGQEVVARIHYRGGVQRLLRGLLIEEESVLPEGPIGLRLEEQEVGRVTSRTLLPCGGYLLGLGIVHQKAEPGALLELVDGNGERCGHAQLVELPFPPLVGPDEGDQLVN